jgi:hypothetical protein
MGNWQVLGASGRIARVVIATTLAILIAVGCAPEWLPGPPPSGKVIVAAGDIADCTREGDEATARLVGGMEGTVLTLGDNVYPDGTAQDFEECYEPTWGTVQGAHQASPRKSRVRNWRSLSLLRLLR